VNLASNASDALLAFYFIQYVSVGITGLLGCLQPQYVLISACAIAALLWYNAGPGPSPLPEYRESGKAGSLCFTGCVMLVIAYLAGIIASQYSVPPLANDSLTYHLPAAVDWMQKGKITLYETWLFNPANTYSPLAGSMFIYWLMGPLGNDVLARFVQAPALLLIFFATADLCRSLGSRLSVAAILAAAAVLSRPLFSHTLLTKDDLFLTAFFMTALAGLSQPRLRDPLGPWRVGIALGLMLSTKYTAFMSLPILLLAAGAPRGAGWRWQQWFISIALALVLAGPWFLRNLMLTGNPLYPIGSLLFDGMFRTQRSENLGSFGGILRALADGYFSLPRAAWIVLIVLWIASIAMLRREAIRQPLPRAVLIGGPLGVGLFLLLSPYDEIRFIYPSLVLLFAGATLALRTAPLLLQVAVALLLLGLSLGTNFALRRLVDILPNVAAALAILALLVVSWRFVRQRWARIVGVSLLGFAVTSWIFVYWNAYIGAQPEVTNRGWSDPNSAYVPLADAWKFIRTELPPDAKLAYANTFYVYPLYGFDLSRRVVYAPVRPRVKHIHDLSPIIEPLSGERIGAAVARHTTLSSDKPTWIENLRAADVKYVLVGKADLTGASEPDPPVELTFAEQDKYHFKRIFDNDAASVYEIVR
jgi:4-amino-4-deoxy-L-arabinose transferase-like glycosyltransferase